MQLGPVEYVGIERFARARLRVQTSGPGFTDLSGGLAAFLADSEARDGALTVFVRHTSASLTVQENDWAGTVLVTSGKYAKVPISGSMMWILPSAGGDVIAKVRGSGESRSGR